MRAGPLNVRPKTSSRSDVRSIDVSLPFLASIRFLLRFELLDELVQFVEARVPQPPIALEPVVKSAKRLCAQLVQALVGARLNVDEPDLLEHAQMLRDLGLVEVQ